jgi:hypothetical protein
MRAKPQSEAGRRRQRPGVKTTAGVRLGVQASGLGTFVAKPPEFALPLGEVLGVVWFLFHGCKMRQTDMDWPTRRSLRTLQVNST